MACALLEASPARVVRRLYLAVVRLNALPQPRLLLLVGQVPLWAILLVFAMALWPGQFIGIASNCCLSEMWTGATGVISGYCERISIWAMLELKGRYGIASREDERIIVPRYVPAVALFTILSPVNAPWRFETGHSLFQIGIGDCNQSIPLNLAGTLPYDYIPVRFETQRPGRQRRHSMTLMISIVLRQDYKSVRCGGIDKGGDSRWGRTGCIMSLYGFCPVDLRPDGESAG